MGSHARTKEEDRVFKCLETGGAEEDGGVDR
jgi:hypothetical protein